MTENQLTSQRRYYHAVQKDYATFLQTSEETGCGAFVPVAGEAGPAEGDRQGAGSEALILQPAPA